MPKQPFVGNDGSATIAGMQVDLARWSANITQNVSEVTNYTDTYRVHRGGVIGGDVSLGGFVAGDATATAPFGATVTDTATNIGSVSGTLGPAGNAVTLAYGTVTTVCQITGTIVISNVAMGSDKLGDATISIDGDFSGTIQETWDIAG